MAKMTLFAVAAIALVGACSTPPQASAPNIVTNVYPMQPGTGVVQAVMPTPTMAGAAAGSSEPLQRLEIKMSDGKVQYIDTRSSGIARGDRVQLSADGVIRKV